MWTPKQLLSDEVVAVLREGGIPDILIEFLGWSNGRARNLNRSSNPVKAAKTMLRDPGQKNAKGETNYKTHEWLAKFYEHKRDSIKPEMSTTMFKAFDVAQAIRELVPRPEEPLFHVDDQQQTDLDNE